MYQSDLNRAVARATGENVATIDRLGFQLAGPMAIIDDDLNDRPPSTIDWDIVQAIQASKRHWSPSPCFAR